MTAGAAQEPILGPDLWNVSNDEILRRQMPEDTFLVKQADTIVIVIMARGIEEAQMKLNQVIKRMSIWMDYHGLQLSIGKTELVLLTTSRMSAIVPMRVTAEAIYTKESIKYLGLTLD